MAGLCPKRLLDNSIADMKRTTAVRAWSGVLTIPTYLPAAPDKNPMFLEKRVYQGSSGRVYPLPFTDRIAEQPVDRAWKAVWLENEFLRALVLPEIGGRIHAILDKTNGYDLIYNQQVIKPALVGLAGPWISGGIEFNWPQHHRPATFLPVNFEIEKCADGAVTVWCSDHDPMSRMKGMHGVCLHPGKAYVELRVRVSNRTPLVQTFLWWANVATRVHEAYRSFFPPDVRHVADHARRSMSAYPLAQGHYYGVNYGARGRQGVPPREMPRQFVPPRAGGRAPVSYPPNDLSYFANIPVPTSYMCLGSAEDFFGGYDYQAQAGIVHIANHHISPGKKQWTWGNHEFGYAWDRNLTEPDANGEYRPYIEIMAGVYTDNQPDFSFLQPGEIKTWSQYWYPIQKIGAAQHANLDAALTLRISNGKAVLGVSVTRKFSKAKIRLTAKGRQIFAIGRDLSPGNAFVTQAKLPRGVREPDLQLRVTAASGEEVLSYQAKPRAPGKVPQPAAEPPDPADIASADELFTIGLHLDQYRHATRCPTLYWREALRRDPLDARCNNALGRWHLKRGEFARAETFFRQAIARLTSRNGNPYDGEPHYNLGLCLRYLDRPEEAYAAFYKATWNQAWAGAAYHALAEIHGCREEWGQACDHCEQASRRGGENHRLENLWACALRKIGDAAAAEAMLQRQRTTDPLDWWTRHLLGEKLGCDWQVRLDLAHDYARAGCFTEAIDVLQSAAAPTGDLPDQSWGTRPLVHYTLGWLELKRGAAPAARSHFTRAAAAAPDYCFPARLEEIAVLETAMRANPKDARAPYYLGNLLYDRRRHEEAMQLWERSAKLNPNFSVVWRNLGIGYLNIRQQPGQARAAYDKAFRVNPADGRLLYERDHLWKRLGEKPAQRLLALEGHLDLVRDRDDLSVELCALYNQTGAPEKALALASSRNFQPWEGGEGGPLGQHIRARLLLGRRALERAAATEARDHFAAALLAPRNLGEAKHLLANQSDIHYWLGCAHAQLGEMKPARQHWRAAANFKGDFQEMHVRAYSEKTFYSALAWQRLGQVTQVKKLLRALLAYAQELEQTPAKIDYFATSLPTMLLFADDLQFRQETTALFLQAQAWSGLRQKSKAARLLARVLRRDPNHAPAADFFDSARTADL